jgi:hypothetical protein
LVKIVGNNMHTSVAMGDGCSFIEGGVTYKLSKLEFHSQTGEVVVADLKPDHKVARAVLSKHVRVKRGFNQEEFLKELSEEVKAAKRTARCPQEATTVGRFITCLGGIRLSRTATATRCWIWLCAMAIF